MYDARGKFVKTNTVHLFIEIRPKTSPKEKEISVYKSVRAKTSEEYYYYYYFVCVLLLPTIRLVIFADKKKKKTNEKKIEKPIVIIISRADSVRTYVNNRANDFFPNRLR